MWLSQNKSQSLTCLISKVDETKLRYQKIGHLNLKSMKKIILEDAIKGFLKLNIKEGNICGEFQIGKQTMMSHKKVIHLTVRPQF